MGNYTYRNSNTFGSIGDSKALLVTNKNDTIYIFSVKSILLKVNDFINLIIIETPESTIEYFIKYSFNNFAKAPRLDIGIIDLSSFSGSITYYNNTGAQIGENTIVRGTTTSSSVIMTPASDCDEDDSSGDVLGGIGNNENPNDEPNDNDDVG